MASDVDAEGLRAHPRAGISPGNRGLRRKSHALDVQKIRLVVSGVRGMRRSEAGATRKPSGETQSARGSRREVSPRKPTAIDKHVGKRLRLLRQINEVSLEKLAEIVDVAPQQIQKYEIGETRISASRIFELSKIFRVPLAWFYADLEAAASAEMYARIGDTSRREAADRTATRCRRKPCSPPTTRSCRPTCRHKLIDIARMLSEAAAGQAK